MCTQAEIFDEGLFSYIARVVLELYIFVYIYVYIYVYTYMFMHIQAEIFDEGLFSYLAKVALEVPVRESDSQVPNQKKSRRKKLNLTRSSYSSICCRVSQGGVVSCQCVSGCCSVYTRARVRFCRQKFLKRSSYSIYRVQ